MNRRRLVDSPYRTVLQCIALPFPCDVNRAPQLVVVSLAQAALAALHRALDSAHPVLAATKARTDPPELSDCEHFAVLALDAGDHLAELLSDYSAAVVLDNLHDDDSPF